MSKFLKSIPLIALLAGLAAPASAEKFGLGRAALPEEIAETVLFACSDAASYLTADTIKVSGGIR